MAQAFDCTLVTPEEQLFHEPVAYASVPGWDGLLGVAPQRAPLLIKLGSGPLRLDLQQGTTRWFFVSGGFAQMKDNRLTLVAESAAAAENLDQDQARKELDEALAIEAVGPEQVDQKHAAVEAARQKLQLLEQVAASR